ncbi:MAG: glycosyltransferase [Candidatus Omnitrophica bacterium]|nr:glycosyltransferase [Candidatus Omnitrophota bacterium]
MNILFVAPRLPVPADTGAKIRTLNILKQIVAAGHKVAFLSFVFGPQKQGRAELEKLGCRVAVVPHEDCLGPGAVIQALMKRLPLSAAKYRVSAMAREIVRMIKEEKIDMVHFDHIHMGQYADVCPGKPTVVDEHNVECLILKRLYGRERNHLKKAIYHREYMLMAALERRICKKAFRVFVVSEEDKRNLQEAAGGGVRAEVIPNGVDVEYFRPPVDQAACRPEDSLVFTGSMDWLPNSDALEYFCRDVLPLIWQKKPDVAFYVVGKNPGPSILKLGQADKRIIVTGSVADVRPYVERAKVFVVPLRIGGGTRLKILEAMSMRKAIVSTTLGAEGIEIRDGQNIVLADTPQDFADKVCRLLDDESERSVLGESGRELVKERYDWRVVGRKLNEALMDLAAGR